MQERVFDVEANMDRKGCFRLKEAFCPVDMTLVLVPASVLHKLHICPQQQHQQPGSEEKHWRNRKPYLVHV